MTTKRPGATPAQQLARPAHPLAAPFRLTTRWLSAWKLDVRRRRLDRQILLLQQQLSGEFATLDTQALHDELALLQSRRAALDQGQSPKV